MKIIIVENLKTGRAVCAPNDAPFPDQDILIEGTDFKIHEVDNEELALTWLDRPLKDSDLAVDNKTNERRIIEALKRSNWVQTDAAKLLKITPKAIWDRIKKYGIVPPSGKWHKGSRKPELKLMRKAS